MIPAKHFYMIRHGETIGNAASICVGQTESLLTVKGRAQAAAIVNIADNLTIKPIAVYHSHLSRARDTAIILNQNLQLPVHENKNIAERHFGDWHGISYAELDTHLAARREPPQGETRQVFRARVKTGIAKILNAHDAPVIITCHGGVFSAFGALYNLDFDDVDNCVLYEFFPHMQDENFPWTIFKYTISDGRIRRKTVILLPLN